MVAKSAGNAIDIADDDGDDGDDGDWSMDVSDAAVKKREEAAQASFEKIEAATKEMGPMPSPNSARSSIGVWP